MPQVDEESERRLNALDAMLRERDELLAWKREQQRALVRMSVILLTAGFQGDDVVKGVEWLAAAKNSAAAGQTEVCEVAMR